MSRCISLSDDIFLYYVLESYHLFVAVGDQNLLNNIMKCGGDIYKTTRNGFYPFEIAIKHRRLKLAETMLDGGFSYKSKMNKRTDFDTNRYLIKLDKTIALTRKKDLEARSALMLMCKAGNFDHHFSL